MGMKGRGNISFLLITSTLFSFISLSFSSQETIGIASASQNSRQALEIIVVIGSPTPSPPDNGDCPDCVPPPESPPDNGDCPDCASPPQTECPPPPQPALPPSHPPPPPPPKQSALPPSHPPPPKQSALPPSHPPPPPPPSQPAPLPPSPPSGFFLGENLKVAIKVIRRFRKRITSDPTGVTATWTGNRICYDKSKYKGFYCYTRKGETKYRIGGVKFNGLHLGYNLPLKDFMENVSEDLVFFHANSNNFTGDIPMKITKLPRLYELDLSNNKFTGAFPKSVLATNLTILDLRYNMFTGPVPPQAFALDLDILFLNNNQFSGNLPENLGQLPVLYLTLANNKFTGPIPKSIGQAYKNLREVLFLNNSLSGCLPYEIGLLQNLYVFDASINQLTGPIPHSFGCLVNMRIMNLANNNFYGAVPETLCKLPNLQNLTLKFNYFTQVGPECRKLIQDKVLDVSMNCILDLPSQKTPSQCHDFFSKHHSCPDPRSLNYVPCKINQLSSQETRTKEEMAPSPSYAALNDKYRYNAGNN